MTHNNAIMYIQSCGPRRTRAWILSLLFITGCAATSAPILEPEQEATIADTLFFITMEYNAAWEELDFNRISEYHADSFTYNRRGIVDSFSNADFERAHHENVATQITSYWSKATETWVEVLGSDAGVVAFVFRGGVTTPDGSTHVYDDALTYVYERRGGQWKIVHIHESAYDPESPLSPAMLQKISFIV